MESVVTLTASPAIDVSAGIDEIAPVRKLRFTDVRRDPGGGGVNVARVVWRLGREPFGIVRPCRLPDAGRVFCAAAIQVELRRRANRKRYGGDLAGKFVDELDPRAPLQFLYA